MKTQRILGLILAGGQGSRMGGQDKGLIEYKNQQLVSHVINRLSPQCNDLVISANRNLETYRSFGYHVISDKNNNEFNGPIAGICATIEYAKLSNFTALLISSCDTPYLPTSLQQNLAVSLNKTDFDSAVAYQDLRQQNIHCLIISSAWDSLMEFYRSGGRAMYQWHAANQSQRVDFPSTNESNFANFNNLSDTAG